MAAVRSSGPWMAVPLNVTITSFTRSPDRWAGLPGSTEMISAPEEGVRWSACCRAGVTDPTVTPM